MEQNKQKKTIRRRTEKPFRIHLPKDFPLKNNKDFQKLNAKRQAFLINIFLQPSTNWSNARCYKEAFNVPNMNSTTASVSANVLLKIAKVKELHEKLKQHYYKHLQATAESVMREEAYLAHSDITDFLDENGYLVRNPKTLPPAIRRSISSIEVVQVKGKTKWKVTVWNKGGALDRLERVLGMNAPQKVEQKTEIEETKTVKHTFDLSGIPSSQLEVLEKICNSVKVNIKEEE